LEKTPSRLTYSPTAEMGNPEYLQSKKEGKTKKKIPPHRSATTGVLANFNRYLRRKPGTFFQGKKKLKVVGKIWGFERMADLGKGRRTLRGQRPRWIPREEDQRTGPTLGFNRQPAAFPEEKEQTRKSINGTSKRPARCESKHKGKKNGFRLPIGQSEGNTEKADFTPVGERLKGEKLPNVLKKLATSQKAEKKDRSAQKRAQQKERTAIPMRKEK